MCAGLTIDYNNNKLWWVNWAEEESHIVHSELDGSQAKKFDLSKFGSDFRPDHITVHNGQLYATSEKHNYIWSISTDSENTKSSQIVRKTSSINALKLFAKQRTSGTSSFSLPKSVFNWILKCYNVPTSTCIWYLSFQ